ncbi:MAG: radical SAM protein [Bdellovibrionales bacterium]|nr:radical SAM protein [Bdellovibrionales bacterium]
METRDQANRFIISECSQAQRATRETGAKSEVVEHSSVDRDFDPDRLTNKVTKRPQRSLTFAVDSFANGIAFGQQKIDAGVDPREIFSLHLKEDLELMRVRSRYALEGDKPLYRLEKNLMQLSQRGLLRRAHIYFGVTTDPFFPFDNKFDASMRFLELFLKYTPGLLTVQTRSPLIVIAMPVLKRLAKHAAVTIPIETCDEAALQRYAPGYPRIQDRIRAATALRRFNVPVTLQVSPLLPYGDWRRDAEGFAKLLNENGDFLYVKALSDGSERVERKLRSSVLARKLAGERKFHWLRADAALPLINAIERIAPDKLKIPQFEQTSEKQLKMFAA